jgi:hypothetical protein
MNNDQKRKPKAEDVLVQAMRFRVAAEYRAQKQDAAAEPAPAKKDNKLSRGLKKILGR